MGLASQHHSDFFSATSNPAAAEHSIAVVEHRRLAGRNAEDWIVRIDGCRIVFAGFDDTRFGGLAIANFHRARFTRYRLIRQPVAVNRLNAGRR